MEAEAYEEAAKCFRRGGDQTQELRAMARGLMRDDVDDDDNDKKKGDGSSSSDDVARLKRRRQFDAVRPSAPPLPPSRRSRC